MRICICRRGKTHTAQSVTRGFDKVDSSAPRLFVAIKRWTCGLRTLTHLVIPLSFARLQAFSAEKSLLYDDKIYFLMWFYTRRPVFLNNIDEEKKKTNKRLNNGEKSLARQSLVVINYHVVGKLHPDLLGS